MLEELFNLAKNVAGQSAAQNNLPEEANNQVVAEATNTVASGLRNIVAGGGLGSLVSMFQGNKNEQSSGAQSNLLSNPIVAMMVGHFAEKLISKFKLGGNEANNISSSLIPNIVNSLVQKTNDPSDNGFSLDGLLNSITGGKVSQLAPASASGGGGLQDILGQLAGGNNGSGGGGIMDIVKQLAGGAQEQQQRNGGGGLLDLIKGFIK